jgi:hypothetical protein
MLHISRENQQGAETKKSHIRAYSNDQSLLRVAVCIMMNINEDWITGNRHFTLGGMSRIRIQGHCELQQLCTLTEHLSFFGNILAHELDLVFYTPMNHRRILLITHFLEVCPEFLQDLWPSLS